MSLLGIDIGTSGCKGAAYSAGGEVLSTAKRSYPIVHPAPGWAELESAEVLGRVFDVIRETAAGCGADPVRAIAFSSMGEAMVPVSADRRILGNSILMADSRGGGYVEELRERLGTERFYGINPNVLSPNYSYPKLKWIMEHRPELFEAADLFLLWGDFAAYMLGCEPLTSFSLANRTLLFDIRKEDWSDELLSLAGISRDKLPVPTASGTPAGTVSPAVAERLGLPPGVLVVVGAHDQCCNSLGSGIYSAGRAVCGIGTVECIAPTYAGIPEAGAMLEAGLNIEHHAVAGLYTSFIYNQAGALVNWFKETFASADERLLPDGADLLEILNGEMPEAPTGLLVLPYFEMTGAPTFLDASGVIAGLKTTTTRGEILKGLMEAETFYFVDSIDRLSRMGIDTSEFVATGGGARSDRWLQIKADIFGVPFVRPAITEAGTLGAAILAGVAAGVFGDAREGADLFVEPEKTFEPDAGRHDIYRERYRAYETLYPSLRGIL